MTWLHDSHGYQVFFNRDERKTRRPGMRPSIHETGPTRFVAPIDGDFGGTWIAANEHGLTLCLLNGFADETVTAPSVDAEYTSRGLLPATLARCETLDQVGIGLQDSNLPRFRPFILVAFDPFGAGSVAHWSGSDLERLAGLPPQPLVSSSFYTEEVRKNRTSVFRRLAAEADGTSEGHLKFHESHDPAAGPYSACMHRPDADTVSFSWIGVDPHEVRFRYAPHSPCQGRPSNAGVVLRRRRSES